MLLLLLQKKNTDWQKKTIEDRRLRITMEKWKNLSANNTQRTAVVLQQQRLATTTTTTSSSAKTAVAASACRLAQACNKMLLICVGKTQNARSIGNWISPFAGADDPGAGSDRFGSLRFGLIKEPFFLCAAKKKLIKRKHYYVARIMVMLLLLLRCCSEVVRQTEDGTAAHPNPEAGLACCPLVFCPFARPSRLSHNEGWFLLHVSYMHAHHYTHRSPSLSQSEANFVSTFVFI